MHEHKHEHSYTCMHKPPKLQGRLMLQRERAQARRDQSVVKAAAEVLRGALALEPNLASAHYELATALLRLGDSPGARPHMELAVEYDAEQYAQLAEEHGL